MQLGDQAKDATTVNPMNLNVMDLPAKLRYAPGCTMLMAMCAGFKPNIAVHNSVFAYMDEMFFKPLAEGIVVQRLDGSTFILKAVVTVWSGDSPAQRTATGAGAQSSHKPCVK